MADFPDAVKLAVDYLKPILEPFPAHVGSRVPNVPLAFPFNFVVVRRAGGTPLYPVRDQARLDVWAWARKDPEAMDLAIACRTAIWEMSGTEVDNTMIYRVDEFMAPQQMDDPETGLPRVWATYELDIRANGVIRL